MKGLRSTSWGTAVSRSVAACRGCRWRCRRGVWKCSREGGGESGGGRIPTGSEQPPYCVVREPRSRNRYLQWGIIMTHSSVRAFGVGRAFYLFKSAGASVGGRNDDVEISRRQLRIKTAVELDTCHSGRFSAKRRVIVLQNAVEQSPDSHDFALCVGRTDARTHLTPQV